ncbi:MAG TPA: MATE family efflux transporter [Chitinophagaceae bacterium]|nr:MATE family efflux transporter [Chitinophagaceae bacterium]
MQTIYRFIRLFRAALKNHEYDYTQGSIKEAIVLLAIPMVLELSLESVFALVDIYFVGGLGKNAITTVGLTESVITIVYSLAIGLSTAATALVSRRVGEKNPEAASLAGAQSILLALGCTVFVSVIGIVFAADILRGMGASPEVVAEGTTFTQVMLGGSVVIILLFLMNGIFRGAGNAMIAMKSLWIASAANIILCPLFINVFHVGLVGAAIATTIGRGLGVLYQCRHLMRKGHSIHILPKHWVPNRAIITSLLNVSWPATLQFLIASASWIVLAKLVAETGGTEASAGYQIAMRNVVFFILPAWGLSNAAATLVGQNLGAGLPQRAKKSVLLAAQYNAIFMSLVTLIFIVWPTPIIQFFTKDARVISYGVDALRIIGCGYLFYGVGMVMVQALNGAGDTKTPTIINLVCFWGVQVPFAFLASSYLGTKGVFIAIPVAETLIAVLAFWYFQKGKWMTQKV